MLSVTASITRDNSPIPENGGQSTYTIEFSGEETGWDDFSADITFDVTSSSAAFSLSAGSNISDFYYNGSTVTGTVSGDVGTISLTSYHDADSSNGWVTLGYNSGCWAAIDPEIDCWGFGDVEQGSPSNATVTIIDDEGFDDGVTGIWVYDLADGDHELGVTEGDSGTIRFERDSTSGNLNVNFSIASLTGSPVRGGTYSDYVLTDSSGNTITGNSITIPDGSSYVDLCVDTTDDSINEDVESFRLAIESSDAYSVNSTYDHVDVSITDDETGTTPTVSVTATDAQATEPATGTATATDAGTFEIRLSKAQSSPVTVSFTLVIADKSRPAYPAGDAQDYTLKDSSGNAVTLQANGSNYTGSVTIAANATSAAFTVVPLYDELIESKEFAYMRIDSGSGYQVSTGRAEASVAIADPINNTPDLKPCTCSSLCECECEPLRAMVSADRDVDEDTGNLGLENADSNLTYYSTFASGEDTVVAYHTLETTSGAATLDKVKVELVDFNGEVSETVWYDGSEAVDDTEYAFALPVDVSELDTGIYDWTIEITQYYSGGTEADPITVCGDKKVINTLDSSVATGWFMFGVASLIRYDADEIETDLDDVVVLRSGLQQFSWSGSEWTREDFHDTSDYTLSGDWDTGFTLTAKDGTVDEFNSDGQLVSTTDWAGNQTTYTYVDGQLTTITEPSGETTTLAYNGGYISSLTRSDGVVSTYTVDSEGRITQIEKTDPDGDTDTLSSPVTILGYDSTTGLLSSITYPDGSEETYAYDHAFRLASITYSDGSVDTYESWYSAAQVDTTGGVGLSETNLADLIASDDIQVTTTIGGVTTTTAVDRWGFPLTVVDGAGETTEYERNSSGQVTSITTPDPDGEGSEEASVTEYEYDAAGNLTLVTLPDGSTLQWVYDATWNIPTQYTDEAGCVTKYTIDATTGNVLSERVIVGEDDTTSSETDDLVTTYTYTDASDGTLVGLVETVTDTAGTVTAYEYDSKGQLITITYDSGGDLEASIEYEYDSTSGSLTAETDELGRRTEYVYDALNRLTQTILPAADTTGATIDNSDTNNDAGTFTATANWSTSGTGISASGGDGSETAVWQFTGLDSDKYYEVFVSWSTTGNASDAPFSIYKGTITSSNLLETIPVNQSVLPEGSTLLGSGWQRLGTYAISGSTLSVLLSNDASGTVNADSVLILEHSCTESVYDTYGHLNATIDEAGRTTGYGYDSRDRLTHVYTLEADTTGAVVDDGDADFSATPTASWTTDETSGEGNDLRYASAGAGNATATWTFDDLDPNQSYVVLVTWTADAANNAIDAPYSVYDGETTDTLLDTIEVNQQVQPAILGLLGANWQSLGTYTPSGDTLTIQLTNDVTSGRVIADSVRVVEASALSEILYDDADNVIGTIDTLGNITEYTYNANGQLTEIYAPYPDLDGALQVDNGDSEVSLYQTTSGSDDDCVNDDYVQLSASNGYARYVISDVEPGTNYEIWVSYPADAGSVVATYEVYDGWMYENDLLAPYSVDQSEPPTGSAVFGENWRYLGTVTASEDYLTVNVSGGTGVVTDAVMAVEARAVTEYVYDSAGRVVQTIDPYGNVTEYVYDSSDRVVQTISADPDGDGDLESSVSYIHYNSSSLVTGAIDPLGAVSTIQYDILGRIEATYTGQVIASTDNNYSETGSTWSDGEGGFLEGGYRTAPTNSTVSATATWTFENLMVGEEYEIYLSWTADETYGAEDAHFSVYVNGTLYYQDDIDQTVDPSGESGFIDFSDALFELFTSFTLSEGDSTTVTVTLENDSNDAGKLVLADAVYLVRTSPAVTTEYDDNGDLVSTADALGNATSYVYDVLGRQVGTTGPDPDGEGDLASPYLWYHYDAAWQQTATVAADLTVATVEYDGRGRAVATYAGVIIDDSSDSGFEKSGNWVEVTDGGLLDSYWTVDSTNTATATWTFEDLVVGDDYDVYITWTSVTGGSSSVPVSIYLGSTSGTPAWTGTLDQSADPTEASGLIRFSDLAFAELWTANALSNSTLIVEVTDTGTAGQIVSIDAVYVVRSEAMSQYVYDNDGMLTATIDADGNETTYTYDALGQVIAITEADPDGTGTVYDAPVYRYYYDSAGQTTAYLSPDGATETYGYDDYGRQTTTQTGQTITPTLGDYDEPSTAWTTASGGLLGSCQTIAAVTGTATATATWTFTDLVPGEEYEIYVSWTADGANTEDAHFSVYLDSTSGTLVYYDSINQTLDPDQPADFAGFGDGRFQLLTSYELHEDDATTLVVELSNLTEGTGGTVVADAVYLVRKGVEIEYVYDFAGRLVATLDADGNQTDYTYDNLGRTTLITLPDPDGDGPLTRPTTEYVYDAAGQVVEIIEYEGTALDDDQRGPEFRRVLGDSVDIGAYEGFIGPETSTIVVTTLTDVVDENDGLLSLREAIELAGETSGHDLITFDASLSGTLTLTLGQLVIDSDMTIEGSVTISGGDASRIFYITGDVTAILSGMTLTDGYTAYYGGAMYVGSGSNVTLSELTITENTAGTYGGGLFTGYAESLVIESCTITYNDSAYYGGGVAGYSDRVYIYDTTVSHNTAVRYGAGVAFYYETLEMVDCVVSDNVFSSDSYSGRYGAGVFLYGGAVTTITGTTIENNRADAAGEYNAAYGGGIATINGAETYLIDCTIRDNEATVYGGGIYSLEGSFEISSTTIDGNVAGSWGGGVCGHFDTLTISDSLFVENEAVRGGGLIVYSADALLTNVTISGNSASHVGGGVYFYGSDDFSARLVGCTITDNTGLYAGGIYRAAIDVRLDNTIVADNTATLYPDLYGVYNENSSNNLIGNNDGLTGITNNVRGNLVGASAASLDPMLGELAYNGGPTMTHAPLAGSPVIDMGSALLATSYYDGRGENYLRTVGTTVDIGAVEYNTINLLVDEFTDSSGTTLQEAVAAANTNPGADTITFSAGLDFSSAVDILLSGEIDITDDLTIIGPGADLLAISGNDAYRIFDISDGIIVRLVGLTLTGGAATGAGGAIRSLSRELTLEECQILDSTATTDGGAIYATGALNLLESTLAGNSATDGGAIMLDGAAAFIRQSTIAENSATDGGGIALSSSATATILQSTIALNTASGNGGGIDIDSGYVLMHNTLVADNSAGTDGPDIDGEVLAESSYNLISDSSGLTGIDTSLGNQLDVDALLGELDYHGGPTQTIPLRVGSPALDAGSADLALTRLGQSSTIVYDSLGRVVQETSVDPDGIGAEEASVVSYTYDANGNLLTETDALGAVTTYEYDHLGQLILVTWADPDDFTASGGSDGPLNSPTLAFQYDAVGQIVAEIESYADSSAQQLVTEYAYDYLGRTVSVTLPDPDDYTSSGGADGSETAPVTTYTYSASGDLLLVTDSAGTETSYEYDSLHRLVQVTDDDGGISAETSYTYDAVGNVILIEDAEGRYTAYEYNLYGEVSTIVVDPVTWDDGSGPVTLNANGEALTYTYAYDAVGNLVSETDPATGTTTYQYDNLGRLLATILDDSTSTAYAYDDLGNLESITDAEGNTTRYGYNELGWLTSETIIVDSVAYTETYEYDAVGQLVQTTDREGRVILYDYDNLGRVYQERWEEDLGSGLENVDTITYEYDDLGNLVSASEVDGSSASVGADYDYTYDLLGRVTELVADLDGLTPDVTFDQTYDSLGNRTEVAVAVGSTLDYVNDATYDALSRLVELSQSSQSGGNSVAEKLVTFDYDDTGLFSQLARYADLAATELVALTDYTFDTAGQLTELSHNGGGLATDIDYTLTYADSLLAAVTLVDGTMDFSYDGVGQLTGVDYTGTGLPDDDAYTYDDTGNRTDSSFVTGDHNRLLSDGTYTYLYDANGNRTARFVDADSSGTLNTGDTSITEYTWDHRNRLTSVTDRDTYGGDAAPVVNYVYDMYNRLIHKELDGDGDGTGTAEDTFWIYDGNQAVLQFDGDTAADLSHRYLWGDAVDQLLADETVDDGGAEDVLWTLTDWQGTVRDLATYDTSTDTTTIANHKVYDAYGNVYDETDDTVDTVFGYTGRMWDDDIDLQWNLNRWYDPVTSRWLSEDPIGFAAGDPNLYRYVANSPAGAVDPSGLEEHAGNASDNWALHEAYARHYQELVNPPPCERTSCITMFAPPKEPEFPRLSPKQQREWTRRVALSRAAEERARFKLKAALGPDLAEVSKHDLYALPGIQQRLNASPYTGSIGISVPVDVGEGITMQAIFRVYPYPYFRSTYAELQEIIPGSVDTQNALEEIVIRRAEAEYWATGNRVFGTVGLVGSALEGAAGAALVGAPEPTTLSKWAGVFLVVHAGDQWQRSARMVVTGGYERSGVSYGTEYLASFAFSQPTSECIGECTDAGLNLTVGLALAQGQFGLRSARIELPAGVQFEGEVQRAVNSLYVDSIWDIHPGNIAGNHRYSASGQGALYAGTSREAVLAELLHYGVDPDSVAWATKSVKIENVLDLTNPTVRRYLGVTLEQLTGDDYTYTQVLGKLARDRYSAILVPSARNSGTTNLVILP